jgi:hypothetical protein
MAAETHSRASGIRVCILRPGLKSRTPGDRVAAHTTVYVGARSLLLLDGFGESREYITETIRQAAALPGASTAPNLSRFCTLNAIKIINAERVQLERVAAKAAAKNNAAWAA